MRAELLVMGLAMGLATAPGPESTAPVGPASSTAPAGLAAPPDATLIRQAVRQLNHPSPARRKAALRQLAVWGPFAFDELRRAAAGPDHEAALAAQGLLTEFQSAILIGGQASLEVDRARVAWNEPLTLTVRVKNPTPAPIRVPWPQPPAAASRPAADDADQVGRMFDVADFLTVVAPEGQAVDLRAEPIDADPAVYQAVSVRAGNRPPTSQVPPGGETALRVLEFNRGLARFPMLVSGTYRITFSYQTPWKDPAWTAEGFGRIEAGPVAVEVTRGAPEAIRRATRPLELKLDCRDDFIRAQVVSTWDRPVHLNLNWGPDVSRYAELRWEFMPAGAAEPRQWVPDPDSSRAGVRADRIRRIDPAESLEIARLPRAAIYDKASIAPSAGPWEVRVRYMNLASPPQLRALSTQADATAVVPSSIYTGVLLSEPIKVEPPAPGQPR